MSISPRLSTLFAAVSGKRPVTGLAIGVFDFGHEGHRKILQQAANRCEYLVAAVHSDEAALDYKGILPANSALERRNKIEAMDIADEVVICSDRKVLCRRYRVSRVFHGDDWERGAYVRHFGRELIEELGLEIVLLPHTAGVSSTAMRARVPKIGWWLYPSIKDKERHAFFDHLRGLYSELGGTWFVCSRGRRLVESHYPDAPRVWMEDGLDATSAARKLARNQLDLVVTANFDYDPMVEVLQQLESPPELVVVSHGRSGKTGASADALRARGGDLATGHTFRRGRVTVHDWSYDRNSYCHLDSYLSKGGSLDNPVPSHDRPRVLLVPTWCWGDPDDRGLLLGKRWHRAFERLSSTCEIVLSPHPFSSVNDIEAFRDATQARVVPSSGRSFESVPEANVVVCDLSGAFWESLLFDTPVILGSGSAEVPWSDDLPPSLAALRQVVPIASPADLVDNVLAALSSRRPQQRPLAESRLGRIDGKATSRTANRIRALLAGREPRPHLVADRSA
jgi:cytidyltransferase-like protein